MFKDKLIRFFPEATGRYRDDVKRQDAYLRTRRVMPFLEPLHGCVDLPRPLEIALSQIHRRVYAY